MSRRFGTTCTVREITNGGVYNASFVLRRTGDVPTDSVAFYAPESAGIYTFTITNDLTYNLLVITGGHITNAETWERYNPQVGHSYPIDMSQQSPVAYPLKPGDSADIQITGYALNVGALLI